MEYGIMKAGGQISIAQRIKCQLSFPMATPGNANDTEFKFVDPAGTSIVNDSAQGVIIVTGTLAHPLFRSDPVMTMMKT